jgi:microcystin-dependent protein
MPNFILTPNMNLPNPVVGVDTGPDYANNVDACLTLIDQHNHSPGYGVLITPNGLDINIDLPFNSNNATQLRAARFTVQASPLALPTDINELYDLNGDLHFIDNNGNDIQITANGSVNATSSDIMSGTNRASFIANQLVVQQNFNNNTPANVVGASFLFGNNVAGSNYLTLQPPNAMPASYSVTLPPPNTTGATEVLGYDTSNNIVLLPGGSTPPGSMLMYGGTSAPAGYLMCDGTSYLRTTYPNLFSAISTAYGSADGTHFNVPDLRGSFPRGVTGASSNDPDASSRTASNPGGNTGNNVGSAQSSAFQTHTHSIDPANDDMQILTTNSGAFGFTGGTGSVFIGRTGGPPVSGSFTSETRPINVYVNYIIKT